MTTTVNNEADSPACDATHPMREVWRQFAHSLSRTHGAFGSMGKSIRDPESITLGRLSHQYEKYDSDENYFHNRIGGMLDKVLDSESPEIAPTVTLGWRSVSELELIGACTRRCWQVVINDRDGTFTFPAALRVEIGDLLKRLEELLYWTLETARLHYVDMPDGHTGEAFRIAGDEVDIARRLFEKSVDDSRRKRESHRTGNRGEIPAEVAFYDFVALTAAIGGHLAMLSKLAADGARQ